MAGLTFTLICVAAAGLLMVIQREAWVRGDQQLTKGLIKSRITWVKGSVGSRPRVLHISFNCVRTFSLVLNSSCCHSAPAPQIHTQLWCYMNLTDWLADWTSSVIQYVYLRTWPMTMAIVDNCNNNNNHCSVFSENDRPFLSAMLSKKTHGDCLSDPDLTNAT